MGHSTKIGIGLLGYLLMLWPLIAQSEALPAPTGAVVLTITGSLEHPNAGDEIHLDMAALENLPATEYSTITPWHEQMQQFTGVRLSTLLESIGSNATQFVAVGLDDYSFTVADLDFHDYPVIIAYRQNGKPISVRNLGPLRIIMPYSDHPELQSQINESRSVWQLVRMELL